MESTYRILTVILICYGVFSAMNAQTESQTSSSLDLPEGCTVQLNVVYKTVGEWKGLLNLYLPPKRSTPVPLVLMFHGGGWNHGKKEDIQRGALPFLKYGWAVANVGYRLLETAPAPAAVEDARCALLWLVDHAKAFNIDSKRIITTGSSSGGHLALIIGLLPSENPFDKDCVHGGSYTIAVIINNYGVTDVVQALQKTHWFDGVPNKVELAGALSPLNYVRGNSPPIISIHGDEDPIVPYQQAVRLHKALDSLKVKNVLYTVRDGTHGKFNNDEKHQYAEVLKNFLTEVGLLKMQE